MESYMFLMQCFLRTGKLWSPKLFFSACSLACRYFSRLLKYFDDILRTVDDSVQLLYNFTFRNTIQNCSTICRFFFFCRLVDLCICVLLGVFVSLLYLSHFSDLLPVKLISCSPPPALSF